MKPKKGRVILENSHNVPLKGAKFAGKLDPDERVEVTLRVRARQAWAGSAECGAFCATTPARRQYLTREEFAAQYGANPADFEHLEQFAGKFNLVVVSRDVGQRALRLAGTVEAMEEAFGVKLKAAEHGRLKFRHRTGPIQLPSDVAPLIEGVFGLDNRPVVRPRFQFKPFPKGKRPRAAAGPRPFTPLEVARLYDFPADGDGSGQCIGILEFGGGFDQKELDHYFAQLGVAPPQVTAVSVDGGSNSPTGDPNSADGEVMLDIEVAGAIAPKAAIAVYFAPNTDAGFLDALRAAVHDSTNKPSVISISWGGPESGSTPQSLRDFDAACQEAAALGVTICVAAGDHGADDTDTPSKRANVDFPASSPHVLACGGTHLEANNGSISTETVWNTHDGWATGGGVSEVFPLPDWQAGANVPSSVNPGGGAGRGVPDVAGDADVNTGYIVSVDGSEGASGGTSAVAPLWSALIALLNQHLGKPLGFINPLLYQSPVNTKGFHDIVEGDNGAFSSGKNFYSAGPGWDACTGWGSPDGTKLLQALRA
ncbi:MAG TPA: S53 family peptidase [Verrucomicrobiae bacterium]|nr:S53 family peptidase [Verrucomicrobiae bacterium]